MIPPGTLQAEGRASGACNTRRVPKLVVPALTGGRSWGGGSSGDSRAWRGGAGTQLPVPEAGLRSRRQQDRLSRAAALELELELRGAGAPAAGQRLLQSDAAAEHEAVAGSRRSRRPGSMLRWFITVILCAAFLGLVRAGAGILPGQGVSRRPAESVVFRVRVSPLPPANCDLGRLRLLPVLVS